jgi:O-antigen ligase
VTVLATPHEGVRQTRHVRQVWWAGYALVVAGGLLLAAVARRRIGEPFLGVSLAVIILLLTCWLIRPRTTLYAVLFLTAVSDIVTVWWFPFVKNLSSRESISFVADALTISPLEISLYLGFAISTARRYAHSRTVIPRTPLTWPIVVFTAFVVFGYAMGLSSGGDLRIAVIEGRALFYILLVFVIIMNECTQEAHLRRALWAVLAGVFVQSLLSIEFLSGLDPRERAGRESLTEHGSSLGQNLILVALIALLLFRIRAPLIRWALILACLPTVYVFFVGQRRAGVAALVVAGGIVAIALYWRRRRAFWVFTPVLAILLTGYVAAFWNSQSLVGFPAKAIKTVIDAESATAKDRSSDLYRTIEHYNLDYTIHSSPVTGMGFGRPFMRPIPLADISFFQMNAFIPHNNVLWIWVKLGFGGFAAMFYMFAKAIMSGADRVRRTVHGLDLATTLTGVCFVVMYGVYSYVDVSWDARNTVFLGLAFALCVGPAPRADGIGDEYEADAADDVDLDGKSPADREDVGDAPFATVH